MPSNDVILWIAGACIVVLWPISCAASVVVGAILYHAIRMLQAKSSVYKQVVPQGVQQRLWQKQMKTLADREAAGLQGAYINGLKNFSREKVTTNEDTQILEIPK